MEQNSNSTSENSEEIQAAIKQAAKVISEANAIIFTSGAGLGVDSGLPDFRGPEGFWRAYPPMKKLGLKFEEMANPIWFREQPTFAWGFYAHRYQLYHSTNPHEGYYIMKKWAEKMKEGYFVYTSNVDWQWIKAGIPEDHFEECHGTLRFLQCRENCTDKIWSYSESNVLSLPVDTETFHTKPPLPACKYCGGLARPNGMYSIFNIANMEALLFGDDNWNPSFNIIQSDNFDKFKEKLGDLQKSGNLKLVTIEIGAGKAVPTVRKTSEKTVSILGATLIRINPRDGDFPSWIHDGISIPLGGMKGLQEIDKLIQWKKE